MDAVDGKSRMDVPGSVRRLVFDAAWIAHQQCCFCRQLRHRAVRFAIVEKSEHAGLCSIEHFRALAIASVGPSERP